MQSIINKKRDIWERPWDKEKFDELSERDDRFFALVIKGALSWLNSNLRMYGKPIKHFILVTSSAYMYLENNGYEYTWCETTGENLMYMETPRCIVSIGSFSVPQAELTAPTATGTYQRYSTAEKTNGQILSFAATIQRLPIEMELKLKYTFSTYNEAIIFIQELFEKILFQQYFEIVYLGNIIDCSLELDGNTEITFEQMDLASKDAIHRTIDINLKLCTNLPIIAEKTEISTNLVIAATSKNGVKLNGEPVAPAPVKPEEPDTPVEPEEPDTPVEPEDPDTPVEPEDPDTPVEPEDPDTPVEPEDPDTPVEPEESENQIGNIIYAQDNDGKKTEILTTY